MIKNFLFTLLVAMIPIIELRGAIPVGMAHGLDFWQALCAGIIGNLIPVPFIILFVRRVFAWMKQKSPRLRDFASRWEKRAYAKARAGVIYKYKLLGLAIFVAIPLPGTGAWTGALIAAMMDIRLKNAMPAISLGVAAAGIIVAVLTHGTGLVLNNIA